MLTAPLGTVRGNGTFVARLERAVRHFRMQATHNLLDEVLTSLPAPAALRDVVDPLMGRLEQAGDPGAVRFAESFIEVRLLAHARGWETIEGPRATLACAPREDGVLALICLGLGLADHRCRIAYLGGATPVSVLRAAAREQRSDAVLLRATSADLTPRELLGLRLLARDQPLLVSGDASTTLARAVGAIELPDDPSAAVQESARILRRRSSRARGDGSPGQG